MQHVEQRYDFYTDFRSKNALKGRIKNVKVDFIAHKYPLVNSLRLIDGVRMADMMDIAAMKLNAIVGNGTRVKDFIDVAHLSSYLTTNQILNAYTAKYKNQNPLIAIKSLTYHNDIYFNEPIEMMNEHYNWTTIDKRLNEMLDFPEKLFEPLGV